MVGALDYMHARGIVHRDLKPANVLVGRASGEVKIADFGFAAVMDQQASRSGRFSDGLGTPEYIAPEVIKTLQGGRYGLSCDVWSLGVMVHAMLVGVTPYTGFRTQQDLFAEVTSPAPARLNPAAWVGVSELGQDFVLALLTKVRTALHHALA